MIAFGILGWGEKALLQYFSVEGTRDFYISTIFLVAAVLAFAVKNQQFGMSLPVLRQIGRKYSGMIYIIHIAVITVVSKIAGMNALTNALYRSVGFILIFLVSLAFAVVWENWLKPFALKMRKEETIG